MTLKLSNENVTVSRKDYANPYRSENTLVIIVSISVHTYMKGMNGMFIYVLVCAHISRPYLIEVPGLEFESQFGLGRTLYVSDEKK